MKNEPVLYKPYAERTPDSQFYNLIKAVRNEGIFKMMPYHKERALTYNGFSMKFCMSNGFPVVTERKITKKMFHGAIAEHIGFLNGATTLKELVDTYEMPPQIWKDWVTKEKCGTFGLREGHIGPASYGGGWAHFPKPDGTEFNQIKSQIELMKTHPSLRTFHIHPWIPYWTNMPTRKVTVAPCHGWIFPTLYPETKTLNIVHVQRSGDVLVGVPLNLIHYAIFGMMLANELGYRFDQYDFTIADAHIYERQIEDADRILRDAPSQGAALPTVNITEDAAGPLGKKFFEFRKQDFVLSDYFPNEKDYKSISTPV
jgi:thymidylate synthase